MRSVTLAILLVFTLADVLPAQSPIPVIVTAATPATKSSQAPGSSSNSTSLQAALKMLQELKAANEETLRKQEATLQQLDELEKAAEQLKIYTKRG
jgi:glutamate-1-semialdehyde aminotransferase